MLDYRYVYLFKVRGKDLYKIGISRDWRIRRIQVQDSERMRLKLRILLAVPLFFSEYFEKRLHKKFAKYRKPLKGVSGGTEFFELRNYDGRVGLRGELLKYFLLQLLVITIIFLSIGLVLIGWSWEDYIKIMFIN
ncbi:MAG: GIY-YIG nuclease family protein [Saprospiraceae bacterium]|nr:GIY-YIG nuclease family protein [Saprospiraceae bacterium]